MYLPVIHQKIVVNGPRHPRDRTTTALWFAEEALSTGELSSRLCCNKTSFSCEQFIIARKHRTSGGI